MRVGDFVWTDAEVRAALGLEPTTDASDTVYRGVSTDSRRPGADSLFVALRGPRFDGHDFIADAEAAGARGAVVSRAVEARGGTAIYPVEDTLVALGQLARHRRDALGAVVVGIAGSVGKTSTKDLTAAALAAGRTVHATRANENNRIGVPLTLLAAPSDAQAVVVEMGTSERGEMAALAEVANPDLAILVTVGEEHLEGLGSRDEAVEEELDILRGLAEGGSVIVGDSPADLADRARRLVPGLRVAGWSDRADPDLRPREVEIDLQGHHSFGWEGTRVRLGIAGRHMVTNALLALATARELGVDPSAAAEAVGGVAARGMRGEVRAVGDLSVVLDCYNANPQSVRAALDLLEARSASRTVVVLGSMLELGRQSDALHEAVLHDALGRAIDVVVATGAFATVPVTVGEDAPVLLRESDPRAAYALLREQLDGRETILLKGSRGVALERILPLLEVDFGSGEPR